MTIEINFDTFYEGKPIRISKHLRLPATCTVKEAIDSSRDYLKNNELSPEYLQVSTIYNSLEDVLATHSEMWKRPELGIIYHDHREDDREFPERIFHDCNLFLYLFPDDMTLGQICDLFQDVGGKYEVLIRRCFYFVIASLEKGFYRTGFSPLNEPIHGILTTSTTESKYGLDYNLTHTIIDTRHNDELLGEGDYSFRTIEEGSIYLTYLFKEVERFLLKRTEYSGTPYWVHWVINDSPKEI